MVIFNEIEQVVVIKARLDLVLLCLLLINQHDI